ARMFNARTDVEGVCDGSAESEHQQARDRHSAEHRKINAYTIRQALQQIADFFRRVSRGDPVTLVGTAKDLKEIAKAFDARFNTNHTLATRRSDVGNLTAAKSLLVAVLAASG